MSEDKKTVEPSGQTRHVDFGERFDAQTMAFVCDGAVWNSQTNAYMTGEIRSAAVSKMNGVAYSADCNQAVDSGSCQE